MSDTLGPLQPRTFFLGMPISQGIEDHELNHALEGEFRDFEMGLTFHSRHPGRAFLGGLERTLFGLAQIVGTVFFAIIRLCQAGYEGALGDQKKLAALYAQEALRSPIYIVHGLANIGRGVGEFLHIGVLLKNTRLLLQTNLAYPSIIEQERRRSIAKETANSIPGNSLPGLLRNPEIV